MRTMDGEEEEEEKNVAANVGAIGADVATAAAFVSSRCRRR